ncbi:MAG: IS3 family transposase [Actinomycetota bacterium]
MTFTFIANDCADLPIEACCRTMKVSRSAFFAWRQRRENPTPKMVDDIDFGELIVKIHDQSHGTYWAPRVTAELRLGLGRQVNHKRFERLMRERGLQGVTRRRRGKRCTRAERGLISDDLVHRQFRPDRPDRLWVQGITQHRTAEGWVYMAVVIDAWSRRVIGWSIADHLRAELVVDALEMARLRRRPDGTTVHSDHGAQYTPWVFGQRLRHAGLLGSMGTVGDALDNAVAESFFASLQCELLDRHTWPTRAGLARAMFHYVEAFYNPTRRHSTLGYVSPVDYEAAHAA